MTLRLTPLSPLQITTHIMVEAVRCTFICDDGTENTGVLTFGVINIELRSTLNILYTSYIPDIINCLYYPYFLQFDGLGLHFSITWLTIPPTLCKTCRLDNKLEDFQFIIILPTDPTFLTPNCFGDLFKAA